MKNFRQLILLLILVQLSACIGGGANQSGVAELDNASSESDSGNNLQADNSDQGGGLESHELDNFSSPPENIEQMDDSNFTEKQNGLSEIAPL